MYYEVKSGEVVGNRLRGAVRGGGEWALIGSDGYLRVDMRAQVETSNSSQHLESDSRPFGNPTRFDLNSSRSRACPGIDPGEGDVC